MDDLQKTVKDSVSSFSSLSVHSDGREISGQDYTELHCFLEDVRDKYDGGVFIRFIGYEGEHEFYIEVERIDWTFYSSGFEHERLFRAILHRSYKQDKFEDYWIENGRLFLCDEFDNENIAIPGYGMELYTIRLKNGSQIREYIPLEITWRDVHELRFRQILRELNCPECCSEGATMSWKKFRCPNCEESIDLTDLSCPLTIPMEDIISYIEENYTYES